VDLQRAADLYAQGWTLRQIGAELGVPWTAVGHQFRGAGVTMRRVGPPAHPASTQRIVQLRNQGLTWPEVAQQVDTSDSKGWRLEAMTLPVARARTTTPRPYGT
jgi:hypothetical protein